MRTITHYKSETLHIETDLGIVNIKPGLFDRHGRKVTFVEVIPDRYAGEQKVKRCGTSNTRLIQLKQKG